MAANEKKVELTIPRIPGVPNADVFVRVNGKAWQIPRGKKVMVPPYVKAEYELSINAQEKYEKTAEALQKASANPKNAADNSKVVD